MTDLTIAWKAIPVIALIIALTVTARADEISVRCLPTYIGGAVSKDPVTQIDVGLTGDNWHIVHVTRSGAQYWRERQYLMRGYSKGPVHFWSGTLISHPNISMSGSLTADSGQIIYTEIIYDAKRGNAIVGATKSACVVTAPAMASAPNPQAPANSVPADLATVPPISVSMELDGGTFTVPVQINGAITLKFMIDSGAADVAIPADVASTLLRTGTLTSDDFIGDQQYTLADGRTIPSMTFRIRSLRIGDRDITDVKGSISPVAGSLLLGQSFLRRFRTWTMDNVRQKLILN